MPLPSTTPSTVAATKTSWYGGRKCKVFTQRVSLVSKAFIGLDFLVPPGARVVHAHVRNAAVATVTGAIGGTAPNAVALMMFPTSNAAVTAPLTAPVSTASASNPAGTNGYMLAITPGTGTSETNGVFRGAAAMETMQTSVPARNNNPVGAYLALCPAHTSSNRVQINTAATDSGYFFGTLTNTATSTNTAGTVDVVLYVESFDDYPT